VETTAMQARARPESEFFACASERSAGAPAALLVIARSVTTAATVTQRMEKGSIVVILSEGNSSALASGAALGIDDGKFRIKHISMSFHARPGS
jgi:hypothetical protein